MSNFRLVMTQNLGDRSRVDLIIPLIREVASEWSPSVLQRYITTGEIPKEYVNKVLVYIQADPRLMSVELSDFLVAVGQTYPELWPIITAPAGTAWLDACTREVTKQLLFSPFKSLIGG